MQRQLRVTVDGHAYDVTVEDLTDTGNQLYPAPNSMAPQQVMAPPVAAPTPTPAAAAAPAPAGEGAIVSPMSGVVVEVKVSVGQKVESGQTVAVIEAMKMKTPLVVDHGGTVASVELKAGDSVQAGQTVLTLG